MKTGYAWVVTEGLSTELNPTVLEGMDSVQSVLRVRPSTNNTNWLNDFKERWEALSGKSKE